MFKLCRVVKLNITVPYWRDEVLIYIFGTRC